MNTDPKSQVFGCRIPNDLAEEVLQAAREEGEKPSGWIKSLVEEALSARRAGIRARRQQGRKKVEPAAQPLPIPELVPEGPPPSRHPSVATEDNPPASIGQAPPKKSSWQQEWERMDAMEPAEAMARFNELRENRKPPAGFSVWTVAQRIQWLEANWPL